MVLSDLDGNQEQINHLQVRQIFHRVTSKTYANAQIS